MGSAVAEAKKQIFEAVCRADKGCRKRDFAVRAQDVRIQLKIPVERIPQDTDAFVHGHSQMHIEVFVKNNERYLRLGPLAHHYAKTIAIRSESFPVGF